jgi:tripartite-type tricarboxylate transporter receptor subunit TctC
MNPFAETPMLPLARFLRCLAGVAIAASALAASVARAADVPDKPIHLIVPYAPGGSADALARSLAELMRKDLNQVVIVDNKPGANTAIGAQALANSPADGTVLLLATAATVVLNPLLSPKLGYDPVRDFAAVASVAVTPLVIVVKPDAAPRSLADLITMAKVKPGDVDYGTTGVGSSLHLAMEMLQSDTGTQMLHVPYKGSAPSLAGVLGGEIHVLIDGMGSSMPLIKGGKLRALAVTSAQRVPALPEVPTVAESGYPKFDVTTWYGVMAPAKTPEAVLNRLNAAIGRATADKGFREQFEALGLIVPPARNPGEFAAYIRSESARWAPLIKAKNITLD